MKKLYEDKYRQSLD